MRAVAMAVVGALLAASLPAAAGEPGAGEAALASARASLAARAQQSVGLGESSLRGALAQREAELARAEELGQAREKMLFAAFALSAISMGKVSAEAFWEIAPAPAPLLRGKGAAAFSDGSTLRLEPYQEGAAGLRFEGLSANACRALAERALEQALDASGASDPFRRHALMQIEFGRQTLESLSFRQARQSMAAPEGLAAQWLSASVGPASEAALRALSAKEWDPCAQLLPGEAVTLRFREKTRR